MIAKLFLVKELKKFKVFFGLLIFTLLLGTMGLTGISVVSDQVKTKLSENAKELQTSDLVVRARRDLFEEEKKSLYKVLSDSKFDEYKVVDVYSMIRHENSGQTRLTELRGIEDKFPFYGKLTLATGEFKLDGLYISKDLAELWSMKLGDVLKVGTGTFVVKGIVINDSSQGMRGFSLAPRIYLPLQELINSGLLKEGATGSFAYHFLLPNKTATEMKTLSENLLKELTDASIRVLLPEDSSEQSGRVIGYLTDFMALAALIGLLLSLVGMFYLYQSHLVARLKDYCLLNLMGLSKKEIIAGLILQFSLVFLLVLLIQSVIILPLLESLKPILSDVLGMELSENVSFVRTFSGIEFLFALTISILIPLFLGLMRTPMGVQLKASKISMGTFRFYDFIPFVLILWGFTIKLSHSFKIGSIFFLALSIVFLISTLIIKTVQFSLKKIFLRRSLRTPNLESAIAFRNIVHSGHKLTLSFLSICMGATLISLIMQLDRLVIREFTLTESKPALFIFDIQEDQMESFKKFTQSMNLSLAGVTPMIRARIERVNGEAFKRVQITDNLRTREDEGEERIRNRGLNLTFRRDLSDAETIVKGKPFPSETDPEREFAYVSLEKRFAQRMGLKIGDKVTFDVQGIPVEGEVLNFREVKWTSFYPNFFVNVEPGFIDEAPKTYLGVLPSEFSENKREFQRKVVGDYPNISFIDVEEMIAKLSALFEKSKKAIEIISWLSLAVGFIILYGLSHDQVYRRYYDLALMKSLGFSESKLRNHLLYEFGFIFFLAMLSGFLLGWIIAAIIGLEAFKLTSQFDFIGMLTPCIVLTLFCLLTILISSRSAIKSRPRELLADN